jgi:hypothetical protein
VWCSEVLDVTVAGHMVDAKRRRRARESGDHARRRGVEPDDIEYARVVGIGDREPVRDHANCLVGSLEACYFAFGDYDAEVVIDPFPTRGR